MTEKTKKYRVHDREFKINAAKLVNEQGMTKSQVAKDLGVSPSLMSCPSRGDTVGLKV